MLFAAAVPLVIASTAWACARLAIIHVSPNSAKPGATVTVTGRNFDPPVNSRGVRFSPVSIRLDSRNGPVLAQATTDSRGRFSVSMTVPKARAGSRVLLGTQHAQVTGAPSAGTPARAVLRVAGKKRSRRSSRRRTVAPVAWLPAKPGGPGATGGAPAIGDLPAAAAAGGILALALSGAGLTVLLGARRRRTDVPASRGLG
ncbi:MAG: hypothetical protein M3N16_01445 [Actinomycetota bacterium]|nr:hypothetical protein [Actinomycetota bacterium]